MQLLEFDPEGEFEKAILDAQKGRISIDDILSFAAEENLYVSSKEEVHQDGSGFDPLLLEEGGKPLVAVFSSLSRPSIHRHMAKYLLQMNGREFFLRLPPSYGFVLNPGYAAQLIVHAEGVTNLKKELARI